MEVLTPSKRNHLTKQLPEWIVPAEASKALAPFSHPDWLFERAFNGTRCIIFKHASIVRIVSTDKKDLTSSFPEIAHCLALQKGNYIVDGYLVALDGETTSQPKLQLRFKEPVPNSSLLKKIPVFLYLFDMLHGGEYDITGLKLLTRKDLLQTLFHFEGNIRFCDHRVGEGKDFYSKAVQNGWDGIIARKLNSSYRGGKSENWLRIDC